MGEQQSKFSLPEIIFAGIFLFAAADIVEILLLLLGLDDFWITDIIFFPGSQIYLRIKGVKLSYNLAMQVLELIPYVGKLPLRTAGFAITVYLDKHPEAAAVLTKAAAAANLKAGAGAKGGGGLQAAGATTTSGGLQAAGTTTTGGSPQFGEKTTPARTPGESFRGETAATSQKTAGAREITPSRQEEETNAYKTPETGKKEETPEELFGINKEPLQEVEEIMEKMPEPEIRKKETESTNSPQVEINKGGYEINLRKAA